ncbi:MAG: efflux RND transporter periplasmic adaptor subunit [Candidatus Limimorpha sp.]
MRYCFIILSLSLLLLGCVDKKDQRQNYCNVLPVEYEVVGQTDGTIYRNYVGSVRSEVEIPLSFTFGGQLVELYVHNGQAIHKGDIIAKVDDTSAKSLYETSLATLRQAQDGYERLKKVYEDGGISEVRWVQMETDLEKARQSEISARKHLEQCTLYAFQDGVISMGNHVIGEDISPMETFCRIIDLSRMNVEFSVPEREISLVKKGDWAIAEIPALGLENVELEVVDKSIVANPFGHTYAVKTRIVSDNHGMILPGMVAKIKMSATALSGIVIPSSCVQIVADGISVWVVDNGKAYRRMVEVGDFVKNGVLVKNGLNYGDTIVTVGYQKLYNGARVSL